MRRFAAALAGFFVTASVVVTGTVVAGPPAHAVGPVALRVGTVGPIGSLDPRHGDSTVAREVWNLQYPTLVTLDPTTLDAAPGVATGWSPATDGHGWIYSIDPTRTWSDGRPVTATDVVYSLEHARTDGWPYARDIVEGLHARALDPHTVEVTSTTNSTLLPTLLLHVVPAHVLSRVPDLDADPSAAAVGAGRWHVASRTADRVQMEAPPGAAPIGEIDFVRLTNDQDLVHALATGAVDVVSTNETTAAAGESLDAKLRSIAGVTVVHANDGAQYALLVSAAHPALVPPARRAAIAAAVDRDALVQDVLGGIGRPQSVLRAARADEEQSSSTPTVPVPDPNVQAPSMPALTIGAAPSDATGQAVVRALHDQLAHAGITTTIVPSASASTDLVVVDHPGADDPRPMLDELTCASGHWCDATYDADAAQLAASPDPATRAQLAQRMLQRAVAAHAEVALFAPDTLQAFRSDHVGGWLRAPEQETLVVFAPGVQQYDSLVPASPPAGEDPGNRLLLVGGAVLAAGFLVIVAAIGLVRRRQAEGAR